MLLLIASAWSPAAEPLHTDAGFAWRMAERAVAVGPRHSGSEGARRSAEWMAKELKNYPRFRTRTVSFEEATPHGPIVFRNLIAELPGQSGKFVVIGAHYDTKHLPELGDRFLGANDGASGVAALLAIIRALDNSDITLNLGVRFVFFDGEECRKAYAVNDGLHGSRHYVRSLRQNNELTDCRAMLLLDMVGDRDLQITFPASADPVLRQWVLEETEKLGSRSRFSVYDGNIIDDDLPFLAAGIPTLNFIDFNYGPGNSWWHSAKDTLDKLSPQSLKTVADAVLALLLRINAGEP